MRFGSKRRVYYMLEFSQALGHISEARKLSRAKQTELSVRGYDAPE